MVHRLTGKKRSKLRRKKSSNIEKMAENPSEMFPSKTFTFFSLRVFVLRFMYTNSTLRRIFHGFTKFAPLYAVSSSTKSHEFNKLTKQRFWIRRQRKEQTKKKNGNYDQKNFSNRVIRGVSCRHRILYRVQHQIIFSVRICYRTVCIRKGGEKLKRTFFILAICGTSKKYTTATVSRYANRSLKYNLEVV